jgi:serine/threonine-protein kinase RsbW
MEVDVHCKNEGVLVIVRDHGRGMTPLRAPDPGEAGGEMHGVGLSLMAALATSVEFRGANREGTETRMMFETPMPPIQDLGPPVRDQEVTPAQSPGGETFVSVANGPLAGPVLGHVVAILAARARFSLERVADVQLITDTLAAHAPPSVVDGRVNVGIDCADRELTLCVGPLVADDGEEIVRRSTAPGIGGVLEQLSDQLEIVPIDGDRALRLTLTSPR